MTQGLLPRRYAKALYAVAADRGDALVLYKLMQNLNAAFVETPQLADTVANPFVADSDKTALLVAASGAGDNATFVDFLHLLEANKRTALVRDIALAYVAIYRTANNIYRIDIVSAANMADNEKMRLEKIVAKHIGNGTLEFFYSVDASLIGGFTVTVNSERLDASISTQLKQLRRALVD